MLHQHLLLTILFLHGSQLLCMSITNCLWCRPRVFQVERALKIFLLLLVANKLIVLFAHYLPMTLHHLLLLGCNLICAKIISLKYLLLSYEIIDTFGLLTLELCVDKILCNFTDYALLLAVVLKVFLI